MDSRWSSHCWCAGDDPVKLCRLRIRNDSGRERSLSVTAYVEWVLSPARVNSAPHIITETRLHHRARCWRAIPGITPFPAWRSPISAAGRPNGPAIGANSWVATGHWMRRRRWSPARHSRAARGAALDPCSALRGHVELAPGEQHRFPRLVRPGRERGARSASWSRACAPLMSMSCCAPLTRSGRRSRDPRAGDDTGSRLRRHDEWLAAVPDAGLPHLGARGVLPGERRVWISRSAAGCDGAGGGAPAAAARADPARGGAAIPRGRRAALVAAAQRPGRAHAHLRRSRVAGLRHGALHSAHRRSRDSRRRASVHRRTAAAARAARFILRTGARRGDRPRCSNTAAAASRARSRWASTDCR